MSESTYSNYDAEPVEYCSRCYSLKIKYEESIDSPCCMDCGCSDVETTSIENWEKLYEGRYGKKYVVKQQDPSKTYIYNLPINQLKNLIFNSKDWRKILRYLYPHFPKGYSKIDSILLFFDKLVKDNRLNDLRLLLYHKLKH